MSTDGLSRSQVIDALTNTPTEEFLARRSELGDATERAGLTADEINAALAARPDLPRPLLPGERDVLLAILGCADFLGRDQLVAQVDSATVVGYCPCPCATVALRIPREAPRAIGTLRPIPNEALVLDANGEEIGMIIVFTDDGYLSALEISDWLDVCGISPLPPVDRLQLGRFETEPIVGKARRLARLLRLERAPIKQWRAYSGG